MSIQTLLRQDDLAQFFKGALLQACDEVSKSLSNDSTVRPVAPRVLSLDEIDKILYNNRTTIDNIFWVEVRSKTRYSFGVFQLDFDIDDNYEALILGSSWPHTYRRDSYGIRWRCWDSKPSEKQRKETPWDEGEGHYGKNLMGA